jgi:hypothetical protein
VDHALLLSGNDIKDKLVRPSQKELEIASAEFSIDYLGSKERIDEFHNCERIADKGAVYVTKTILFPARFIYLAKTGKIAGNDVSYKYYTDKFSGTGARLIEQGYMWRLNSLPSDLNVVKTHLEEGLVAIYSRFIDVYTDKMGSYGENELRDKLVQWKKNMTNLESGTL